MRPLPMRPRTSSPAAGLAIVLAVAICSTARADVGDSMQVSFSGQVSKVQGGVITADVLMQVTINGHSATTIGVVEFKPAQAAHLSKGDGIQGDLDTQIVWQSPSGATVAKIVRGRWSGGGQTGETSSGYTATDDLWE